MDKIRRTRFEALILEELATVVPRQVKDPRVGLLTFTRIEVTPDGKQATAYVTLLGGPDAHENFNEKLDDCVEGLKSAGGFLRRHLAKVVTSRNIPFLVFKADHGLENTFKIQSILNTLDIKPEEPTPDSVDDTASEGNDTTDEA